MQRLVRLRQFREEIAEGRQLAALAAEREAESAHAQATAAAEAIGAWKVQQGAKAIDLGFYQAAILAEAVAMEQADALKRELSAAESASSLARTALTEALLDHKVARYRHERLQRAELLAQEKHEFDQLSDLAESDRGETR
jgi:hypothetical protein